MIQSNALNPDHLNRAPLWFRSVVFWEHATEESFEVYVNPLSGWWFRLRRATESDAQVPASGYILEGWQYGDPLCRCLLTDHAWVESATLAEIISLTAVLATEQTSPKVFLEGTLQEQDRIQSRAKMWLKESPDWVQALTFPSRIIE